MRETDKQKWESKQGDLGTTESKDPCRQSIQKKENEKTMTRYERGELEEKDVIGRKKYHTGLR